MSLLHYFFSFHGRINRQQWWLGFVALMALSFALERVLFPDSVDFTVDTPTAPGPLETAWNLALCWPTAAVSSKRLNDRGWPLIGGLGLGVMFAIYTVANGFGYFLDYDTSSPIERAAFTGFAVVFIAVLIDNAFLKGMIGANQHGPEPVGG
jgi:uncharacterized membrane protein YhaH (DUF805 family)